MAEAKLGGRGSQADYRLGTSEGWSAFNVVRWHAVEELSRLFTYDITLMRPASAGPADLDALLDTGATLRIATEGRFRPVHGIIAEAEELDRTSQIILYRVLLVPHFYRARHRTRCRNFVDQTLKDILTAILENRSPAHPKGLGGLALLSGDVEPPAEDPGFDSFTEPQAQYRWLVSDDARITDATVSPYITQYNASDFDFFSWLLESEGLSYYFEHAEGALVLTITDAPGQAPLSSDDEKFTRRGSSKSGHSHDQEVVRSFRDARRMQSRAVTMRDYDYLRSRSQLEAQVRDGSVDPDVLGHYEFPAGDELNKSKPAEHAAQIRMERYNVERELREGISTVRRMEPGRRFTLVDGDDLHPDVDLLTVRVETYASELGPQGTFLDHEPFGFAGAVAAPSQTFESRFVALPAKLPFRPARMTPKPRIHGVQTAVVTSEEFDGQRPVINADKYARVRVRFPWDQRADQQDRTPTSNWIRVSQYWAGGGYGALYNPRVGHEVLVAYQDGDPDRPIIVGRVYNGQNTPPYNPETDPTKSTVKSHSAKGTEEVTGFNEIRFEDKAKKEEIFLHAQKDFNETVLNCHSTSVGADQSNSVGHNQSNSVDNNRTHTVKGTETVHVIGDRTTNFDANESHTVGVDRTTKIGANDKLDVGANETITIGAKRSTTVGADDMRVVGGSRAAITSGTESVTIGGSRATTVGGAQVTTTGGAVSSIAGGDHVFLSPNAVFTIGSAFQVTSSTATFKQSGPFVVQAAGCTLSMSPGVLLISNGAGATIALTGGLVNVISGTVLTMSSGANTTMAGGAVGVNGAGINLTSSGDINATGGTIKLNG